MSDNTEDVILAGITAIVVTVLSAFDMIDMEFWVVYVLCLILCKVMRSK